LYEEYEPIYVNFEVHLHLNEDQAHDPTKKNRTNIKQSFS